MRQAFTACCGQDCPPYKNRWDFGRSLSEHLYPAANPSHTNAENFRMVRKPMRS